VFRGSRSRLLSTKKAIETLTLDGRAPSLGKTIGKHLVGEGQERHLVEGRAPVAGY
jgi:hypothetical protein